MICNQAINEQTIQERTSQGETRTAPFLPSCPCPRITGHDSRFAAHCLPAPPLPAHALRLTIRFFTQSRLLFTGRIHFFTHSSAFLFPDPCSPVPVFTPPPIQLG